MLLLTQKRIKLSGASNGCQRSGKQKDLLPPERTAAYHSTERLLADKPYASYLFAMFSHDERFHVRSNTTWFQCSVTCTSVSSWH